MNIETANILLSYRKKHNLSQEELAEKIGVSQQMISYIESGLKEPKTTILIRIADIFNCSLDELTGRKNFINRKEDD